MAFRKVAPCHYCNRDNGHAEMMYIPQDFQEEEDESYLGCSQNEENESVVMEYLSELPDLWKKQQQQQQQRQQQKQNKTKVSKLLLLALFMFTWSFDY